MRAFQSGQRATLAATLQLSQSFYMCVFPGLPCSSSNPHRDTTSKSPHVPMQTSPPRGSLRRSQMHLAPSTAVPPTFLPHAAHLPLPRRSLSLHPRPSEAETLGSTHWAARVRLRQRATKMQMAGVLMPLRCPDRSWRRSEPPTLPPRSTWPSLPQGKTNPPALSPRRAIALKL